MRDETIAFQLTEKGRSLNQAIERAVNKWLELSELTKKELIEYKNVSGFHIEDDEEGYYLAYYDQDGEEQQIGVGICKEELEAAQWIFGWVCAFLDNGSGYKSDFSKEYLKWGAKYEQRT